MNVLLGAIETVEGSQSYFRKGDGNGNDNGAFKIGEMVLENGEKTGKNKEKVI